MNRLYEFFRHHKAFLWSLLLIVVAVLAWLSSQCRFEENIFQLLPKTENADYQLTFTNLRLKDKIFVQVRYRDDAANETPEQERMAEAMEMFMSRLNERDQDSHHILYHLSDVDPLLLLDAAEYAMAHGPAYVNLSPVALDSLCTEQHIQSQIAFYKELLSTDMGDNFYDVIAYDPCGIAMSGAGFARSGLGSDTDIQDKLLTLFDNNEDRPSRYAFNHIFTQEGKACIGFITPSFGTDDSRQAGKLLRMMNEVRDEVAQEYPDLEVLYHGTIVLAGGNSTRMRKDLALTIGISMLFILLMLCIFLKRPTYLILSVLPIGFGILLALAGHYLIRGGVSLMSIGLGAIVLGVGFSYVLHVLIHYIYTGDIHDTLDVQTRPVLLGSLTTIGAFAGLLFTQSQLLKDFGLLALMVIIGTTIFSLAIMPQFLPRKHTPNKRAFALLEKANSYNIDRNIPICCLTAIWVVVCISFSGRYQFDSNLRNIGYISSDAAHAQNSWNELMNEGYNQQYFASVAPTVEEALEQLPLIERTIDSLRQEGVVVSTMKTSLLMPSLKTQQQRVDNWTNYFTRERRDAVWHNICTACQKEGIEASLFEPFRQLMEAPAQPQLLTDSRLLPPEVLENFVEQTHGKTLVYFPVKSTVENAKPVKDRLTLVKGCMVMDPYYYSTNLVELIHSDFDLIMWVSFLFVFVLLLVTYRNIWLTLIALAPMLLSWYTVLGAMALFNQPFNLINIIVSSFVFGIGVDYSIFILEGLLKGEDGNPTMTYNKTAITLSATILVICMFVLGFAVHPAIQSISFASLVGMITTIMLSYTLEPNLYKLYIKLKKKRLS